MKYLMLLGTNAANLPSRFNTLIIEAAKVVQV
jgi:hypothetical protein